MAGELKREQRPGDDALARARPLRPTAPEPRRIAALERWFDALDPRAQKPRGLSPYWAVPLFVLALVAVAVVKTLVLRVLLPVALAVAAVLLLVRRRRSRVVQAARRRGLSLKPDRLDFESDDAPHTLLFTDAPFGFTLLANQRRESLVGLLSSSAGTFSVGAAFDAATRRSVAPLLEGASTAADDTALEAIAPDGEPLLLAAEEFAALVEALAERNPSCLSRFVLSDARGAPITLDGPTLAVGDRVVDLSAPVEWRSLVFQETLGRDVLGERFAVYQGTWVRQGATEFVLVSLVSLGAAGLGEADIAGLDRGALRDLRLMQAAPEQPPPAEQRVAIERLFMLPLRAALDRAPRSRSSQSSFTPTA